MYSLTVLRLVLLLLSMGFHCTPLQSSEPLQRQSCLFSLLELPCYLSWGRGGAWEQPQATISDSHCPQSSVSIFFPTDNHDKFVVCCWSIYKAFKIVFDTFVQCRACLFEEFAELLPQSAIPQVKSPLKKKILLPCNSHTIHLIHLNCTTQCFLVYSQMLNYHNFKTP